MKLCPDGYKGYMSYRIATFQVPQGTSIDERDGGGNKLCLEGDELEIYLYAGEERSWWR